MTQDDKALDELFAAARDNPLPPSPEFLTRVLADAGAMQPEAMPKRAPVPVRPRPGFWARLTSALGGAVAVASIGTAAMAGLVVGYVQPDALLQMADSYGLASLASDSIDLLPSYDSLLAEE